MENNIRQNVQSFLGALPKGGVLCAASKTRSFSEIESAIDAGVSVIGMNYLQETLLVKPLISKKVIWSFIGQLQSNKIRRIVLSFDRIETVSSKKEAELIDKNAESFSKVMEVMIEVNVGQEANKNGVSIDDVEKLFTFMKGLKHLRVIGLMAMGSVKASMEVMTNEFRLMKSLYDRMKNTMAKGDEYFSYLSMGMSDSYKLAIECGSNYIRIGTGIYGPRK